jgi:hypothetical protein
MGQSGRSEEASALVLLLDSLIERVQRSPLMRRAPAQCSPEEQMALAALLADLVALRTLRISLERLPVLRLDQVSAHWPELGALLSASRRGGGKARPRDGALAGVATAALFDVSPPDIDPDQAPTEEPEPGEQATAAPTTDLAHPILEALTVQGKALNTTQMLTWLHEHGIEANRGDVMDTLFRHEELFRRRGGSHWVVATQETS